MNVVAHQVTFNNFRFLVPGELMKYLSKMPLERTKNQFLPPLRTVPAAEDLQQAAHSPWFCMLSSMAAPARPASARS